MRPGAAEFAYPGSELDLFAKAENWKNYWSTHVNRYVKGCVLEVGAGIGSNSRLLLDSKCTTLVSLELDPALANQIRPLSERHSVRVGRIEDLNQCFDTILYIDVLEHIEADREELEEAAAHLKPEGHLIVLAPAHGFLYTPFDAAIGHHRRYTRSSLAAVAPRRLRTVRMFYLDAAGMLASAANRVLQREIPTERQILIWDRLLIPVSRMIDPLLGYRSGRSITGVWQSP